MRPRLPAALILLFAAGLLITYFRDPNLYRFPAAAYEDGRDMFGFYYNHPEPGSVLRYYNGYVSLLPNIAGWLIARAPVTWIPTLLALFGLVVAALAFAWLARAGYARLIASDRLRWLACLTLALAPLGNYHYVGSTTYSVWNLLFLLILLSLGETPRSARAAGLRFAAMAALSWSHPLSVALIPIWLHRAWHERHDGRLGPLFHGGLAASALVYQLVGVQHAGDRALEVLGIARVTGVLLLERVFFNTLLSDRLSRGLHKAGDDSLVYLVGAAIAVLLIGVVVLHRRRFERRRLVALGFLAYLIVALTTLYVVGRSADLGILTGNPGYRYFWVQRLCLIVAIFMIVEPIVRSWSGARQRLGAGLLLLVLAADLWWLNRMDNGKYQARVGQGRKLAAFTEQVAGLEARGEPFTARHERGQWSIELVRPAPGGD